MSKTIEKEKKLESEVENDRKYEDKNKFDELNEKIKVLEDEINGQKDKFLRLAAEYENYRKRSEKVKAQVYDDAVCDTISKILIVADSIDMASKSCENADDEYKKGLFMIKEQLSAALSKLKVEPFAKKGDVFDPNIHNAISHIEDENLDENVIFEVFQKGYKIGDKVIRHAMVIVAN